MTGAEAAQFLALRTRIVAPMLGMLAPSLLPVSLLLMLPLNCLVAWRERNVPDVRSILWITVGQVVGTFGGGLMLVRSMRQLSALTGIATIVVASSTLLLLPFPPTRMALMGAGLVTGVTESSTGIGGPPLALV